MQTASHRYSVAGLRIATLVLCINLWQSLIAAQQSAPTDYTLGPNDLIVLSVANLDEMSNKPMRIDGGGDINLPLVGHIHAADLTASQLEKEVEGRLQKQLNEPHVIVSISNSAANQSPFSVPSTPPEYTSWTVAKLFLKCFLWQVVFALTPEYRQDHP